MAALSAEVRSQLLATTLSKYKRKLYDNVTGSNMLLATMRENGKVTSVDGGVDIRGQIIMDTELFAWYEGTDTLTRAQKKTIADAAYSPAMAVASLTLTGEETAKNNGEAALKKLLKSKLQNAENTLKTQITNAMYRDGSTPKSFVGLDAIIAVDPTVGTVGGVPNSSSPWWRNKVITVNLVGAADDAAKYLRLKTGMNTLYRKTMVGTEKVDVIIRFIRCTFIGPFKALVNAANPTATGASRPRYEFIDCDIPAGVNPVDNRGTAEVIIRDSSGRSTGRVPSGRLLTYAHLMSGTTQAAGNVNGFNFLCPVVIDDLAFWDAIEFPLTAAGAAGSEARLSVYGVAPDDRPGFKVATLATMDLTVLPAATGSPAAVPNVETSIKADPLQPGVAVPWANKRTGKFWLLGQLKPSATQAGFMRISNVLPGFIFPTEAERRSNGNNFSRAYAISVADLPYGADSPETLPANITALDAQTDNFVCWLRRQAG